MTIIVDTPRKLASIQKINAINPIEGADKIEVCTVLNWECVVKKGEYKVGDMCVYVEIDSILPERPEFEFMRERKFKVKTIKLRKQVSQGIVFPMTILPVQYKKDAFFVLRTDYKEGDDVTEILGIVKNNPEAQEENDEASKSANPIHKFLMDNWLYRKIYLSLNTKVKRNWPEWITKTDETRIQVCAKVLMNNLDKEWYESEKLDGQSATYFTRHIKKMGFKSKIFGVCSRNIWLKSKNSGNYWNMAEKYDLENKMRKYKEEVIIQGEIVGPAIKGNKYKQEEQRLWVFNVLMDGRMLGLTEMMDFCIDNGLWPVPMLGRINFSNKWPDKKEAHELVKALVDMADGESLLKNTIREGIVIRLVDNPRVSFKVISPKFLLKYDK